MLNFALFSSDVTALEMNQVSNTSVIQASCMYYYMLAAYDKCAWTGSYLYIFGWPCAGIVFNPDTATRQKLRKILTMHLTGLKQIEASRPIREQEVANMLQSFNWHHEEGREVVNVRNLVTTMNMNVVSRMLFNKRFCANEQESSESVPAVSNPQEAAEFKDTLYEIFECFGSFYPGDFIAGWPKWLDIQGLEGRLKQVRKRVEEFGNRIVNEHKERRKRLDYGKAEKDMVDLLLDWKEEKVGNDTVTESNVLGMIWVSNMHHI